MNLTSDATTKLENTSPQNGKDPGVGKSKEDPLAAVRKTIGHAAREIHSTHFPVTFLYGAQGVGKTYTAATASQVPELSPVCLIPFGETDDTLKHKKDIDLSQIVIADPREHAIKASVSNLWDASRQTINKIIGLKPFPFKTLILDDFSILQHNAEEKAQTETPFHEGASILLELTQQGDYRLAKDRIFNMFMNVLDLCLRERVALFITAQERLIQIVPEGDSKPDDVKTYKTAPALMPSLSGLIAGQCSVVGRMRVSGSETMLETRRTAYREAKDRTGVLDESMKSPTVAMIVQKLRSGGWEI